MLPPKIDSTTYRAAATRSRGYIPAHPKCIIVHDTDAPSGDSRKYLAKNDRNVGIHDLIWYDGTIYNYAATAVAVNHAGVSTQALIGGTIHRNDQVNLVSYGIELERKSGASPFYPDDQLLALGWRINELRSRFGNIPVFRHGDIDTAIPKRRWDPRQLTIAAIDQWCMRARGVDMSEFQPDIKTIALWGSLPVNWRYAIPQVWLKRPERYGKALTHETYQSPLDTPGVTSIQVFEHGFIVYSKAVNKAFGRLYSEM